MLKEKLDIMKNRLNDAYMNFEKIPMKGNRIINPKINNTEKLYLLYNLFTRH